MSLSPNTIPIRFRTRILDGVTLSGTPQTATFNIAGGAGMLLDAVYTGASGNAITFTFVTDNADSQTGLNIGKTDLSAGTITNLSLTWTTTAVNDKIRFPVPMLGRNVTVRVTCASGGTLILSAGVESVGG